MKLSKNDMFEIGVENAEVTVTQAAKNYREYLHSRNAERCAECGIITCAPVWVIRQHLCRDCANIYYSTAKKGD